MSLHSCTTILRIMKTLTNSPDVICDSSPASGKRKQNYNLFKFFKKEVTSFLRNIFAVLQKFMVTVFRLPSEKNLPSAIYLVTPPPAKQDFFLSSKVLMGLLVFVFFTTINIIARFTSIKSN